MQTSHWAAHLMNRFYSRLLAWRDWGQEYSNVLGKTAFCNSQEPRALSMSSEALRACTTPFPLELCWIWVSFIGSMNWRWESDRAEPPFSITILLFKVIFLALCYLFFVYIDRRSRPG